jgi:hypothetical protein
LPQASSSSDLFSEREAQTIRQHRTVYILMNDVRIVPDGPSLNGGSSAEALAALRSDCIGAGSASADGSLSGKFAAGETPSLTDSSVMQFSCSLCEDN